MSEYSETPEYKYQSWLECLSSVNEDLASFYVSEDEVCELTEIFDDLKAKLQAAQNPDFEALLVENERLCELINAIEAKLQVAEAERERLRERFSETKTNWDAHQSMDCAIKCANEIEEILGTRDVVEATRKLRELKAAEARAEKAEGVVKAAMAWSARWKRIQFRPRQHNLAAPVLIQQEDVDLQAAVETLVEGGNTL